MTLNEISIACNVQLICQGPQQAAPLRVKCQTHQSRRIMKYPVTYKMAHYRHNPEVKIITYERYVSRALHSLTHFIPITFSVLRIRDLQACLYIV